MAVLPRAGFIALVSTCLSCGGEKAVEPPVLTTFTVSLSSATIQVGQTAAAAASGLDQNGSSFPLGAVTWSTGTDAIATVTATGVVSGVAPGQTVVIASLSGKQAQQAIAVIPVPVAAVTVVPSSATVVVGGTQQLTATARDSSGGILTGRTITWKSSSLVKATVSQTGLVMAVAIGMDTITALSDTASGIAVITVTPAPVAVVTVTPSTPSLIVGARQQLTAATVDQNGVSLTGRPITWTTSDASKATVSASGLVTAIASGAAAISATSEGKTGSAQVTVATLPTVGPVGVGFAGTPGTPDFGSPDPSIAPGPDRLLIISNSEVVISTKTGNTIARVGLDPFFKPAMTGGEGSAGDVAALYDESSGRFFLSQAAKVHPQTCVPGTCVGHYLFAVSKTSTPTSLDASDWYYYAFDMYLERTASGPTATINTGDFGILASNGDALIYTLKRYSEPNEDAVGAMIRIADKSKMIAGEQVATWTDLVFPAGRGINAGLMPARMFSASPTMFFVSFPVASATSCGFTVWGMTGGLSAPAITTQNVALAGDCNSTGFAPQAGGGPTLDVESVPLVRSAVFRNGRLWLAGTWQQDFGSGVVSVIKWAELDVSGWPSAPSVVQQGSVGADGVSSFYPAITVDPAGAMVLAFNTSSATSYPSISVAMRYASDPPGTMRPTTVVKAGVAPFVFVDGVGKARFADFLSMELDPSSFASWIHGQYGTSGLYQTWVVQIKP